jgi:hypothetical protein
MCWFEQIIAGETKGLPISEPPAIDFDQQLRRCMARYHGFTDAIDLLHQARRRMIDESLLTAVFGEWYRPYRLLCDAQRHLSRSLPNILNL